MTFKLYKGEKLVLEKKVNMYLTALCTARFKTFSPVHPVQTLEAPPASPLLAGPGCP